MIKLVLILLLSGLAFLGSPISNLWVRSIIALSIFLSVYLASVLETQLPHKQKILWGILGSLIGSLFAFFLFSATSFLIPTEWQAFYKLILFLLAFYFGYVIFYDNMKDFAWLKSGRTSEKDDTVNFNKIKVVDTSAIIDGRILDISESGFLEGVFIIPKFVLHELQLISDSSDSRKRQKGRRGLDLVQRMQKSKNLVVQISDRDFPEIKTGVDAKLVALAKELNGGVVTTDFNLNKVAKINQIKIYNINELATALRPTLVPGETLEIDIIKQGKDRSQGIGYLADGTMVVVENGNKFIGKKRRVEVTSVLQSESGRMVFAK